MCAHSDSFTANKNTYFSKGQVPGNRDYAKPLSLKHSLQRQSGRRKKLIMAVSFLFGEAAFLFYKGTGLSMETVPLIEMKEIKMNRIKTIGVLVFLVFITAGLGNAQENAKEIKTDNIEMKLMWSKQYEWPLAEGGQMHIADDGKKIVIITQKRIKRRHWKSKIEMLDTAGSVLWSKAIDSKVLWSRLSENGEYLMTANMLPDPETYIVHIYYDSTGKVLWSEENWAERVRPSPDGEYVGYSGALNTSMPSGMDVFEVRDKNFKRVMWQYKPQKRFKAIVLNGGRALMIEGNRLRLFDSGGRIESEVIIADLKPYLISYQWGAALPNMDVGPNRLVYTKDGRYVAFVYSMEEEDEKGEKDWLYTLFSVDLKTGKWWSYPLKTTAVEGGVHVTSDGKNVIVFMAEGLFFFDNIIGKLLWKDTTGWDKWGGPLASKSYDVCEKLKIINIRWSFGVDLKGKNEKRFYILDFHGKKKWQTGGRTSSYYEQFCKHNSFLISEIKRKVSMYEIVMK